MRRDTLDAAAVTPAPVNLIPPTGGDLTVLRSSLALAKILKADGSVEPYGRAKHFDVERLEVRNIRELAARLAELESDPHACVIRGAPVSEDHRGVPRNGERFADQALNAIMFDIECDAEPGWPDPVADPENCLIKFIETRMPEVFMNASFFWQLSNSAGTKGKEGQLRAHAWFWLTTAYDSATLRAWAEAEALKVDRSVFNPVQVHYTAAPVLEPGVADPVPVRSGFCEAADEADEEVALEIDVSTLNGSGRSRPASRSTEPLVELDDLNAVERAELYLRGDAPLAVEGQGGDHTTFGVAAKVKDYGVSEDEAYRLMSENWNWRCTPPWEEPDLRQKVANAYAYGKKAPGCDNPAVTFAGVKLSAAEAPRVASGWANAFTWVEPHLIPRRRFLYGGHFIRGFMTATVATGGVGKSSLLIAEALAVATGKPLLGVQPAERGRVWIFNGEDPADELRRRITAAMLCHGVAPAEVNGWLMVGSGREAELTIASQIHGAAALDKQVEAALIEMIRRENIALAILDPFVKTHRVAENSNGDLDLVCRAWAHIAEATDCAIHLAHHLRKLGGREAVAEDARGGSALHDAARHLRVLNAMDAEEASRVGIEAERRRSYVRIDDGKANMAPPAERADWFRLANVELGNGDRVQAAMRWATPAADEGLTDDDVRRVLAAVRGGPDGAGTRWRESPQCREWVGVAIAEALSLDGDRMPDRSRIKELIRAWIGKGWLKKTTRLHRRRETPFIEAGDFAPSKAEQPVVGADVRA